MTSPPTVPQTAWDEWGRWARGAAGAQARVPILIHTVTTQQVEGHLREVEKIARDINIRPYTLGVHAHGRRTPRSHELSG